jgi:uncharacterized membrane protein YdbT with pleckstrin-like domain
MAWFNDYFNFDAFITKDVMVLIYGAGATLLTLAAIAVAIWGRMSPFYYQSAGEAIGVAIGIFIFGNVAWRILCEYIVVLFRINESLISIDKKISLDKTPVESELPYE